TSAATCVSVPRPSHSWPRLKTAPGQRTGPAKTFATARAGRRPSIAMTAGAFPERAPSFWSPRPRRRNDSDEVVMETLLHRMPWRGGQTQDVVRLVDREWLVINGLGGYASGTVSGAATRRYHGLLVAALPAPLGRLMMFNQLWEFLRLPDYSTTQFGGTERKEGAFDVHAADFLVEFRLEAGVPVWVYEVRGYTLEKRLFMPHQQNTVFINYRLT